MQWWPVPLSVVSYLCNLRNEWFLTCGSLFPWPLVPWLVTFVECALHVNLFNLFILVHQDRLQKLPQIINAAEKVIQMVSNDGNCFRAREVRPAGSITYAKTPWLLNFCTVANLSYQLSWWLKFIFIPSHQITSFFKKPTPFVISTRVRRWWHAEGNLDWGREWTDWQYWPCCWRIGILKKPVWNCWLLMDGSVVFIWYFLHINRSTVLTYPVTMAWRQMFAQTHLVSKGITSVFHFTRMEVDSVTFRKCSLIAIVRANCCLWFL